MVADLQEVVARAEVIAAEDVVERAGVDAATSVVSRHTLLIRRVIVTTQGVEVMAEEATRIILGYKTAG